MIKKEITYGEEPYIAYDNIIEVGKLGFQATMKKK